MPCRKQVHSSTKSAAEYWVPAFAGMTELGMRVLFRTVVYRETRGGRTITASPAPART